MHKNIHIIFSRRNIQVLVLSVVAILGSFSLGIRSAGELQPISLIEAGSIQLSGDIDGDGVLSAQDAIIILEIAQGYRKALPEQLIADPNRDGQLTIDDAIRVLSTMPTNI